MFAYQQRLWKRMKRGDPAALDEMLRLYYQQIYAYLCRLSHSPEEAQDMTQETFAKAIKALPSQDCSDSFKAWLYRIARNVWLNARRGKISTVNQSEEWWASQPSPTPPHSLGIADRQQAELLWKTVDRLDDEKRNTIYLRFYQNLSIRETAQVLGVAPATVKYRLREAIKTLRDSLQCAQPHPPNPIVIQEKEALNNDE